MPDDELITSLQSLLATYRRTLAHLVQQAALHGGELFSPPATANGLIDARTNIARIKAELHARGSAVADEPNDVAPSPPDPALPLPPSSAVVERYTVASASDATATQSQATITSKLTQADVLLVTVTEIETKAVLKVWGNANYREPSRHFIGPKTYYDFGTIGGARTALVRVTTMGSSGRGGALQTIERGIRALHPTYIVMVGIAFGTNDKKQALGDVLVAQQIHFYEAQKVKGRSQIIERGNTVPPSTLLLDRFQDSALFWDVAKVHFGLMLSGEKLIDSQSFLTSLLKHKPEAIGGEMEGAGLYAAAEEAKTDWILVKAICDWADGNKDQNKAENQQMAAFNAARFVLYMLEQGALSPG